MAGLVILAEFPKTESWIFGLLLGSISSRVAWLLYALLPGIKKG
jgi:hypothetical protein